MKFKKEDLQELLWNKEFNINSIRIELISDDIVDNRRWSIDHDIVFKYGEQYFTTNYSVGATEQQDEAPFEHDPDEIECEEVFATPVTVIKYLPKK